MSRRNDRADRRRRRAQRSGRIGLTFALVAGLVLAGTPAFAWRTASVSGNAQVFSQSQTQDVVASYSSTGATTRVTQTTAWPWSGAQSAMFDPAITGAPAAQQFEVRLTGCARTPASFECTGRGTITIAFTRAGAPVAVVDPVLNLAGFGADTSVGTSQFASTLTISGAQNGATPVAATFGSVASGATNLVVDSAGSRLRTISTRPSTECNNSTSGNAPNGTAGCGSVRMVGTFSSITFNMGARGVQNVGTGTFPSSSYDTIRMSVTLQDEVVPSATSDVATTAMGSPVTTAVTANDTSAPGVPFRSTRPVTFGNDTTVTTSNAAGTYSADPATGAITFSPAAGFVGVAPAVTYRVTDVNGSWATATYTVTVLSGVFTCVGTVYRSNAGAIASFATADVGTSFPTSTFLTFPSSVLSANGMGIASDGRRAYFIGTYTGVAGAAVITYEAGSASPLSAVTAGAVAANDRVAGAVHPVTGRYYFGGPAQGAPIYMYDPQTRTTVQVGRSPGSAGTNGDFAFSATGDLIVLSNTTLTIVDAADVPAAPGTAIPPSRVISASTFAQSDGIAFGNDGFLYTQNATAVRRNDPVTGATVASSTGLAFSGNDLASCSPPRTSTITVRKAVTDRNAATDQFTISLSSGSATVASATTTGTATGVQSAVAGPVTVFGAQTYTISETPTSLGAIGYESSYECVRGATVLASGAGTTAQITVPTDAGPGIVCTFSNTPPIVCAPSDVWVNTQTRLYEFTPSGVELRDVPLAPGGFRAGDIAWTTDGSQLWAIPFGTTSPSLYRIDPSTGSIVGTPRPLTFSGVSSDVRDSMNALSGFVHDGTPGFLLASDDSDIIWFAPLTGSGAITVQVWGQFATGTTSAGDFLTLRDGSVLGLSNAGSTGRVVRFSASGGSGTVLGSIPLSYGAAQSGATLYLAGADGTLRTLRLSDISSTASTAALPVTAVTLSPTATRGPLWGAASKQDAGGCAVERYYALSKSATPASQSTVLPGETVRYAVDVVNSADVAFTALNPASFSDDLSSVLDDASFVAGSIAVTGGGSASVSGTTLQWSGPLPVGATVRVSYSVRLKDGASGPLVNSVTSTNPAGSCAGEGACTTTHVIAGPNLVASKSASPASGTAVKPSQEITYTLRFDNTLGGSAAVVDHTDLLAGVLDDATWTTGPAVAPAAAITATRTGDVLRVTGLVPAGAVRTVTYSVTVKTGERGDDQLANVLVPTGETPPTTCAPLAGEPVTCTTHPIYTATVTIAKELVDENGATIADGVGWTVSAAVTGAGALAPDAPQQVTDSSGVAAWEIAFDTQTSTVDLAVGEVQQEGFVFVEGWCSRGGSNRGVPVDADVVITEDGGVIRGTLEGVGFADSVTCIIRNMQLTTLTLEKTVSFGSAEAASWLLSATGPSGSLPGPFGATATAATTDVRVTPAVAYALAESGGPPTYVQAGGWVCVDADGDPVTVSGGSVTLDRGTRATCTVTNATSTVTILKHVAAPIGSATASTWNLTATPDEYPGLLTTIIPGAEYDAAGNAASTFEARPGHAYTLSEQVAASGSTLAYRFARLEQRVGGTWVPVSSTASTTITAPPAGTNATYRFVNEPMSPLTLPLTGGASTDSFLIAGTVLLATTAVGALLAWRRRRLMA